MPYELYLRQYDRTGAIKHAVINPLWARWTDSVSGQEPLVFALDTAHPFVGDIAEFDIWEVLLKNTELGITDFTRAGVFIQRDWDRATDDDGLEIVTFTAPNQRHILSWRHILWYAGVADRSDFAAKKAETVMKNIVKYNLTALATVANGRQREGNLSTGMSVDLTVAADGAAGNTISIACMGMNVLTALQKVAEVAGGDFSLDWAGGHAWTFAWHPGQLGADKSAGADRVLFATAPGNETMLRPRLTHLGAGATTAIAAGKGDGLARAVTPVNGVDYAANYDLETFVDARNENTADGRTYRGAIELEAVRARGTLEFDVNQTANQFYSPVAVTGRKTYKAGDLVLATYGVEKVHKIDTITLDWKPPSRGEAFTVSVTTREVPGA